uniref:Ig-like domain-containing protein n=1 Tax=Podarcis muralis TaxID=64176 RepID=A0A670K2H1_PODMU
MHSGCTFSSSQGKAGSVISQNTLTQPPSQSVSPGETIKLSCTASSSRSYIYWYQQRPGQAPRYVHRNGGSRGEGIPDRFTASLSGNMGYLIITNIQGEDEAVYYCAAWFTRGGTETKTLHLFKLLKHHCRLVLLFLPRTLKVLM